MLFHAFELESARNRSISTTPFEMVASMRAAAPLACATPYFFYLAVQFLRPNVAI
jgi:hypothetical protein